jgi:hypothetical protein
MNISSVGASQSLDLTALLAKLKSAKSTSGTDTTTSDTLSLSVQAQLLSGTQGSNPFQTDFENLGKLIDSGDLAGAKKAFAAMQAKMQAHQSDRADQGGTDPLADGLAAIGKALDSGDTNAAQTAFKALQTQLASLGGQDGPGSDPFEKDLAQLGSLMDAGDLAGAKALFQTMQDRMKAHKNAAQDGSTSQSGTDPATSLAAIGSALSAGDLSAAKSAWSALLKEIQNSSGSATV